jgi:Zn2+/Cd2+-exporting ATPase
MTQAVLEIPITCPEGPLKCVECAECVRQRLLNRPGIRDVSVHPNGDHARITLNYDSEQLTLGQLEREVRRNAGCFSPQWGHAVIPIDGMVSPQSEQLIDTVLNRIPGVMATASYASGLVRLEFEKTRCAVPQVIDRLGQLGYRLRAGAAVTQWHPEGAGSSQPKKREAWVTRILRWLAANPELAMPIIGACFLLAAYFVHANDGSHWIRGLLLAASFACSSRYTGIETLRTLRHLHVDIEVLMFVAAGGAIALGHFEEGALLLVLFGLGSAGENMAMDRARRAINALADLAPDTAILRDREGRERVVRAVDLQIGDHVVIRPFARMPVDGIVLSGNSAVDQSPITGESVPVEKESGGKLFAGTINGDGTLIMSVSHRAEETKLAKIVKLVAEAQTTKSPTQVLTDRVERWYVPAVLVVTASLVTLPPTLGDGSWSIWFYRAMAFLTAASPCAIAIGTPAAVLSGIARAARGGVLIKGGVHLENLGRIRVIAFDKTGTLTRGRAEVTDVIAFGRFTRDQILCLAASIEKEVITHPLAAAIVAEAATAGIVVPNSVDAKELPGIGVTGFVDAKMVSVGRSRPDLLAGSTELRATVASLENSGKTAVVVTVDGSPAGVIGLADQPRDDVRDVLDELRRLGVRRTVMLTGDNAQVAAAIAARIGVDEFAAELMPEDKMKKLKELEQRYGRTAMVGDGVNDAPALATATVGIAMGGAGTDIALETADVALMSDALEKLPEAIGLSRFSRRIIAQNLCLALGVILFMAPAAAIGEATLGIAVVAHEGSTVLVVLNALRLLVYRRVPSTLTAPSKLDKMSKCG